MYTHSPPATGDSSAMRHAMDVAIAGTTSWSHCVLAVMGAHAHGDPSTGHVARRAMPNRGMPVPACR